MSKPAYIAVVILLSCLAGFILWPPITSDVESNTRLVLALTVIAGAASLGTVKIESWGALLSVLPFMVVVIRPALAADDPLWILGWIFLSVSAAIAATAGWLVTSYIVSRLHKA